MQEKQNLWQFDPVTEEKIVNYLADQFKKDQGMDLRGDPLAMQRLKEGAEKAKIELSSSQQTDVNLPYITADASGPKHMNIKLTRAKLESLVDDLVQRTHNTVLIETYLPGREFCVAVCGGITCQGSAIRKRTQPLAFSTVERLLGPDEPMKGRYPALMDWIRRHRGVPEGEPPEPGTAVPAGGPAQEERVREAAAELSALEAARLSARSRARHLVALRGFYRFLVEEEVLDEDPVKGVDLPKIGLKLPEVLSVEEVERLLITPDTSRPAGARNVAMLEILYAAGLRVSELVNLKLDEGEGAYRLRVWLVETDGKLADGMLPKAAG